ncbi:hypothetical protein [Microcoleus sp. D3_18a_C4]|uniref:hypothetical protein n=1 Tax=Microcoleus sp. D3_18a_C4 TaxID=3055332 RepID=UPI002FD505FA
MTSNELQETENGLVTVSDFYAHQHESIESGIKQAQIPHQIKFHPFNPDKLWKQGAFRVYAAPEHLEIARDLCMSIEIASK